MASATASSPPPTSKVAAPANGTHATKPRARRVKAVKRRGAKVEEDEGEGESEGEGPVKQEPAGSDSESDFDPEPSEDEEDDDDEEGGDAEGNKVETPIEQMDVKAEASSSTKASQSPKATFPEASHPSWSDQPSDTADDSLPVLDFQNLSLDGPSSSTSTPAVPASSTSAAPAQTKKEQLQARLDAQKARDPVAFAAAEAARAEKKKQKALKLKEKRAALKAASRAAKDLEAASPVASTSTTVAPTSSAPVDPPTSSKPAPTPRPPRNNAPRTAAPRLHSDAPPHQEDSSPGPVSSPAREAYAARLAQDPALIPRVGRFWSHDARLDAPEVRPMNPFWRGRGGRGGRGGPGGFRGGGRGGWMQNGGGRTAPEGDGAKKDDAEGDRDPDDDGWGRGEAKRVQRSAVPPSLPAWSHDGFDELETAPPPPPKRRQNGNGPAVSGPPGSINPLYAHLPFHPKHRFPAAPPTVQTRPEGEADLFPAAEAADVHLPGVNNASTTQAPIEAAQQQDGELEDEESQDRGVVVNLGAKTRGPVTVFPAPKSTTSSTAVDEAQATAERQRGGTSILYAADPTRHLREQGVYTPEPMMHHHLPPHLLQQQHQIQQPAYLPYPPQFYSPDTFPGLVTPGATPPPLFSPSQQVFPPGQQQPFFAPPRAHKVEIKAPGSPAPNKQLSASGDAFQPRGEVRPSDSPVSHLPPHILQQQHYHQQQQQQMMMQHQQQQHYDGRGAMFYGGQEMYGYGAPMPPPSYMGQPGSQQDPAIAYFGGGPQYYPIPGQNGQAWS